MDIVNQYLADNYYVLWEEMIDGVFYSSISTRPKIICKDGFSVSVQASDCHYCHPRATFKPVEGKIWYEDVELGYPSMKDDLITEYAEDDDYTKTVYGYVPIDIVVKLIEKHGGIDN